MTDNDFDEFFTDEPIEDIKLDLELIKTNIPQYSNEKLCEMIACDRYFGFEQKISALCMEELAQRRINGDVFDFESYIDQVQKEFPVLNTEMPDLRAVLNQAIAIGKKVNNK